jgi:hypothetical protein
MEHWKLVEINKGRWLKNNIITLPSESSNATSGSDCIHLCYTYVCICVFAEMFFNRKVKATRSTVLTIFE